MSVRLSVCQCGITWLPPDRFLWNFMSVFFESLSRKFEFRWTLTWMTGTLHEDQYTFLIISHSFLLRMKNVSDKSCKENQNTYFIFNENQNTYRAIYEKTWKNILDPDSTRMTIWRTRIACSISTATNIHWSYVIFIAFPLATLVAWSHINVTLYVNCLSCLF
jgi:endoglucanase Acf2